MMQVESGRQNNTEVRVANIEQRTEKVATKIEQFNTHFSSLRVDMQANEIGLRRLEELCEQTANHLAVIHRFMSAHVVNEPKDGKSVGGDSSGTVLDDQIEDDIPPVAVQQRRWRKSVSR